MIGLEPDKNNINDILIPAVPRTRTWMPRKTTKGKNLTILKGSNVKIIKA